jgi:hypothetical protein
MSRSQVDLQDTKTFSHIMSLTQYPNLSDRVYLTSLKIMLNQNLIDKIHLYGLSIQEDTQGPTQHQKLIDGIHPHDSSTT